MADLNKIYLYRMMHIANVPHILVHGITHRTSANANPNFTPIDAVLGFIVYNEIAKNQLIQFGVVENQIHINANAYF
jgi:hypothetical protein